MSFSIVFCNDGILRVKHLDNQPLIPLIDFQNESKEEDYPFMVKFWEDDTIFENGLTIGNFLNCLQPWENFWSLYTHKNISEYIKESKKPAIVKPDRDKWYAMITYSNEISAETKSNKSMDDFKDLNEFFNDKTPPTILPFWNVEGYYKLTGYKIEEVEHYTLDHTPINEIAHMPIILNPYQVLNVNDYVFDLYGNKEDFIINQKALGLREVKDKINDREYVFKYVLGHKTHKLREVIDAFFWWFSKNPDSRDEFNQSLMDSVANLHLEEDIEDNDLENNLNESEEPKELQVIIDEDAFSGLKKDLDSHSRKFNDMIEYSKKHSHFPIKIGKLQSQPLLEKRIDRYISTDEDIKLN